MNKIVSFLTIVILTSCGTQKKTDGQVISKKEQIITKISFPKENPSMIILNNKHAFNYSKNGNDFEISSLNGEKLILGLISNENGLWKSNIEFLTVNKKFSNSKIIGRNDLIFSLAESNVITENFEIDKEKLLIYIEKFNGK